MIINDELMANPSDEIAKDKLGKLFGLKMREYPVTAIVGSGNGEKEMKKSIECWFMGGHSDVGGGNTLNDEPSLSNIPFR